MTQLRRLTPTICAFHLGFGLEGSSASGIMSYNLYPHLQSVGELAMVLRR